MPEFDVGAATLGGMFRGAAAGNLARAQILQRQPLAEYHGERANWLKSQVSRQKQIGDQQQVAQTFKTLSSIMSLPTGQRKPFLDFYGKKLKVSEPFLRGLAQASDEQVAALNKILVTTAQGGRATLQDVMGVMQDPNQALDLLNKMNQEASKIELRGTLQERPTVAPAGKPPVAAPGAVGGLGTNLEALRQRRDKLSAIGTPEASKAADRVQNDIDAIEGRLGKQQEFGRQRQFQEEKQRLGARLRERKQPATLQAVLAERVSAGEMDWAEAAKELGKLKAGKETANFKKVRDGQSPTGWSWRNLKDLQSPLIAGAPPPAEKGAPTYSLSQKIDDLRQDYRVALRNHQEKYGTLDTLGRLILPSDPAKLAEYRQGLALLNTKYRKSYKKLVGKEAPFLQGVSEQPFSSVEEKLSVGRGAPSREDIDFTLRLHPEITEEQLLQKLQRR